MPLFTGKRVTRSRTRRIGALAASTAGCVCASTAADGRNALASSARDRRLHFDDRKLRRAIGAMHRAEPRHGGEQRLRVRMLRRGEERVGRALLDLLAAIHHQHAVGHFGDHAHVVRDEDHAPCSSRPAGRESVARICAWIVTSSAVVGSSAISSAGLHDERHRDHHALAHAARQAGADSASNTRFDSGMRTRSSRRSASVRASASALVLMQRDRLGDLVADREHRVQRRHRLLEDHRDVGAADRAHRRVRRRLRGRAPCRCGA